MFYEAKKIPQATNFLGRSFVVSHDDKMAPVGPRSGLGSQLSKRSSLWMDKDYTGVENDLAVFW